MQHGHASLGLQARIGVEARVRRLGQGLGARVRQKSTVLLDLLETLFYYYSHLHCQGLELASPSYCRRQYRQTVAARS